MGTIYTDPATRRHYLNYSDVNGRRVRKSSRTDNLKSAEMMLRRIEADIDKARAVGMNSVMQIQGLKFGKFVQVEYLPHVAPPTHTEGTYASEVELAGKVAGEFGDLYLSGITGGDVQRYLDKIKGNGYLRGKVRHEYSPARINRYRAFLSGVFSEAVRRGYVTVNPVAKTKKQEEGAERVRYLTDLEERRLLSACVSWLAPIIRFALATGMRQGEIRNLTWAAIDRQTGQIRVTKTKSKRDRSIKLGAAAEAALIDVAPMVKDGKAVPYVFPDPETGGALSRSTVVHAFMTASERAGLEDFTFHDLRHDFGTKTYRACKDLRSVQKILGHASIVTTTRYAHAVQEDMDAAIDARDKAKCVRISSESGGAEAAG